MDMQKDDEIAEAKLTDWRNLAQGLHARNLGDDFGSGARSRPSRWCMGAILGR
jgi:4a-hydroxytetrahydrobiopterin dehydratase